VVWDDFVAYVVREGWGGVENLSLIPGRVGATAVQNIGAYGQELADVIESVAGIDLLTGEVWLIGSDQCEFAYRNSIFKNELKNTFVITSILFRLEKFPELQTDYHGVAQAIQHIPAPGISDVRNAVVSIRRSKLPDPEIIGNAGSFFKNPLVSHVLADKIKQEFPNLPIYPSSDDGQVKFSAGWLIDQCGWKGVRRGDAGVHEKHALVLVNYGNASGREIFDLSEEIRQSVADRFGIELEREVNVVGL
jgi:UDP-N-acetylmuramate dehydrogenase